MTQKDYIRIAATLRDSAISTHNLNCAQYQITCNSFARMLATDNSRFKADKFFRACGL